MEKEDTGASKALEDALKDAETAEQDVRQDEGASTKPDIEGELAKCKDKLLRGIAEMDNLRKRNAKDVKAAYDAGMESAIMPTLRILDVFDIAVKSAEKATDAESIRKGLHMLLPEFAKALAELDIKKLDDATGKDFDPNIHDALSQMPSEDVPEGRILNQISCGYMRGGKLVKAAQVIVSSGSPEKGGSEG